MHIENPERRPSVINKRMFAVILIVGMLVVLGLLFILSYNSMVAKSQTVDQNLFADQE